MGYHESAEYYGVYIWEYINVISTALTALKKRDEEQAKIERGAEGVDCEMCADSGLMSTLGAEPSSVEVHPCLCERGKAYPS